MNEAWLRLLLLAGLFLALFAVAEWLYQKRGMPAEHTRKLVHAGTGFLTLLFPLWLQHWWQVALLCGSFLLLLFISKRARFLNSIHAVNRQTHGSALYPVIVAIVFLFYLYSAAHFHSFQPPYYFYLPVLVMAVSDPVAALTGRWYQRKKGFTSGKTAVGSIAFFVTAFLTGAALMMLFRIKTFTFLQCLFLLLCVSVSATAAEYLSKRGWDNFFIPLVVILVLVLFETVY